jgi:hypothetical protein
MILPTMTPEEKVKQMEKMTPLLIEAVFGWMKHNEKKVLKTKYFPAFYTFEREFEGMGKWTVNQSDAQKLNLKELLNYRYKTDRDPFASVEIKTEYVLPNERGYKPKKKE